MSPQAADRALRISSLALRALLGLAVLGVGVAVAVALFVTKPEPPTRPRTTTALTVGTIDATAVEIPREWRGYGTARSMNSVDLAAEVTARVVERPEAVEPGAPIGAGDLIVQLDRTDYLARAEAARQAVAQAAADLQALDIDETSWREQLRLVEEQAGIERRELEQALSALESGAATGSEIDRRAKQIRALEMQVSQTQQELGRLPTRRQALQATLDRLRADARIAEENLARTTIASPLRGVLQRVEVEPGELLAVGAPVARVVDLSRIEVPLRLPASAFGHVRVGDEADLHADGPADTHWTGAVSRIAPEADQATRTLTVFVEVRQDPGAFQLAPEDPLLLPGQFVTGAIRGVVERPRTLVPRRAVLEGSIFIAETAPPPPEPEAQPERPADGVVAAENPAAAPSAWIARRVPVDVLFYTSRELPGIDPLERQWAVLETPIPEGTPIIVTNLDDLTEGRFVEPRPRVPQENAP